MKKELDEKIITTLVCFLILWVVFVANKFVWFYNFNLLGIDPRTVPGLMGILLAPLLHSSMGHLLANSSSLLLLLLVTLSYGGKTTIQAVAIIWFLGGLGTWLFGSAAGIHVGASGIVFGLIGFLLFKGILQKDFSAFVVSIAVFLLYGGVMLSFLQIVPSTSWSGHFFGFLGGVAAAKMLK